MGKTGDEKAECRTEELNDAEHLNNERRNLIDVGAISMNVNSKF